MEKYHGQASSDPITGGGSYVEERGRGGEICNFMADVGVLYGYVETRGNQIRLQRLGGAATAGSIEGITVIWTAPHPDRSTVIIGWYLYATVYRHYQSFTTVPPVHERNDLTGYWIKAPSSRARLLSVDERTFVIPRGVKGGIGQSNIWYADSDDSANTVRCVADYISSNGHHRSTLLAAPGRQDYGQRQLVEKWAIDRVWSHYEDLGYQVKSVESENVGWDLEAVAENTSLRIEVKGFSGSVSTIGLTPNEYDAFKQKSSSYRLCAVSDALRTKELYIFRYSEEQNAWLSDHDDSLALSVRPRESALIDVMVNLGGCPN